MKTLKIFLPLVFLLYLFIPNVSFAGGDKSKETFKVWGNCGMCNKVITSAVKSIDGVSFAKWSAETQMITVKFQSEKTTLNDIKKKIASVGYDTEEFKAKDEVYSKLHHCCQYDRN